MQRVSNVRQTSRVRHLIEQIALRASFDEIFRHCSKLETSLSKIAFRVGSNYKMAIRRSSVFVFEAYAVSR